MMYVIYAMFVGSCRNHVLSAMKLKLKFDICLYTYFLLCKTNILNSDIALIY